MPLNLIQDKESIPDIKEKKKKKKSLREKKNACTELNIYTMVVLLSTYELMKH